MIKFLIDYIKFLQLIKIKEDSIIFYSEGPHHWLHLEDLIKSIQNTGKVIFVTSSKDDNEIKKFKKIQKFCIGNGIIRNLFFKNVKCSYFITSLPDLGMTPFVKSKNVKEYIYVFHSMISTHMGYRERAFDFFDTILCCGAHHKKEIRKREKLYKLKKKKLINYGYYLIDKFKKFKDKSNKLTIAPTWGTKSLFESKFMEIEKLIKFIDIPVILRPHPETLKRNPLMKKKLLDLEMKYSYVEVNFDILNLNNLSSSLCLVTDYSGIAFDFAFGLKQPVIFIDSGKKINNLNYKKINIEPIEISIRKKIGKILGENEILKIYKLVKTLKEKDILFKKKIEVYKKSFFFNSEKNKESSINKIFKE